MLYANSDVDLDDQILDRSLEGGLDAGDSPAEPCANMARRRIRSIYDGPGIPSSISPGLAKRVRSIIEEYGFKACQTGQPNSVKEGSRSPKESVPNPQNQRLKRQIDRGSSPEDDDDNEKVRRSRKRQVGTWEQKGLLACPLHQFRPFHFSHNSITKARYATCEHGFEDLRRLRYLL